MSERKALVVGLGNPGAQYVATRHNIGFMVLDLLADQLGLTFKEERKLGGALAKGVLEGGVIYLLKPMTYMNLSGQALRRCLDFYKLGADDVLVVCDDVAIPFGEVRLRTQGSAGGHNGLKDIERHLGTQHYSRLRLGVGDREHGALADHVLSRFHADEKGQLEAFLQRGSKVVRRLWKEPISQVMTEVNRKAPKNNGKLSPQAEGSGETDNEARA